jgi:hypothetical protein
MVVGEFYRKGECIPASFVNVTPLPAFVFQPITGHKATVTLTNTGQYTVYYGQNNVSQFNGTSLSPRQTVKVAYTTTATYVSGQTAVLPDNTNHSGVNPFAPYTMSSTALAAGSTVVTLSAAATVSTQLYYILGSAGAFEIVQATNGFTGTTFTANTTTVYDHAGSVTVATAIALPGQVMFNAGVPS